MSPLQHLPIFKGIKTAREWCCRMARGLETSLTPKGLRRYAPNLYHFAIWFRNLPVPKGISKTKRPVNIYRPLICLFSHSITMGSVSLMYLAYALFSAAWWSCTAAYPIPVCVVPIAELSWTRIVLYWPHIPPIKKPLCRGWEMIHDQAALKRRCCGMAWMMWFINWSRL